MKPRSNLYPTRKTDITEDENEEDKSRISISKCREILKAEGRNLTDDQILKIRDFMYRLAAIGYEEYRHQQQQTKVIHLEEHKIVNNENSHYLRTG